MKTVHRVPHGVAKNHNVTRQKFIDDIDKVTNLIQQQLAGVSDVKRHIPQEILTSGDKKLTALVGDLTESVKTINSKLDVWLATYRNLKQIEEDELFMITAMSVFEQIGSIQDELNVTAIPTHSTFLNYVETLKGKIK